MNWEDTYIDNDCFEFEEDEFTETLLDSVENLKGSLWQS